MVKDMVVKVGISQQGQGRPQGHAYWWSHSHGPHLTADGIHVWRSELKLSENDFKYLKGLLSFDEQQRADQFVFYPHRRDFIIRRGLLRFLLALYMDMEPDRLIFSYTDYGKPVLNNTTWQKSHLNFSLSHSEDMALFAITSGREVGVDIEYIRPISEMDQIVGTTFSEQEKKIFRSLPRHRRLRAFFDCWTGKEAFVKALGKGLSSPLDQFQVFVVPNQRTEILWVECQSKGEEIWTLQSLNAGSQFGAALCAKGRDWTLEVFTLGRLGEPSLSIH